MKLNSFVLSRACVYCGHVPLVTLQFSRQYSSSLPTLRPGESASYSAYRSDERFGVTVTSTLPDPNPENNSTTLQPEYGRFVTAFCGTFCPAVADHGLIHGAAPRSNSATMRADTSA